MSHHVIGLGFHGVFSLVYCVKTTHPRRVADIVSHWRGDSMAAITANCAGAKDIDSCPYLTQAPKRDAAAARTNVARYAIHTCDSFLN